MLLRSWVSMDTSSFTGLSFDREPTSPSPPWGEGRVRGRRWYNPHLAGGDGLLLAERRLPGGGRRLHRSSRASWRAHLRGPDHGRGGRAPRPDHGSLAALRGLRGHGDRVVVSRLHRAQQHALAWFGRRQGLALTLALTGASVGGMVLVPILVALLQRHGFRFATTAVSVALLASGLPLAQEEKVWTRQAVLRVPSLWTLMVPFALALAAQVGFLVHQISALEPYLGESRAALTVSATTVAALLGRIVIGVLSDRVDLRKLSAVNIGAQGAALAVMAAWPSPTVLV